MPQNQKPSTLLDWLGVSNAPNWPLARPLGILLGGLAFLLFALSLMAAFKILAAILGFPAHTPLPTTTTPSSPPGNLALGAGALIVALLGAPFLIWRAIVAQTTVDLRKEGLMTDRISKAVEHLGAEKTVKVKGNDENGKDITVEETKPNIEVRIGGLLSLERIAQDSVKYDKGRDHVRVMEILCAYVRENAPASGAEISLVEKYESAKKYET